MPQFDVSSFSSQLFWLAIVFAILYFIVSKFIAPKAESILTARNRCIEDDINYAEVYKKEAKMLDIEKHEKLTEVNIRVEEMQQQAIKLLESHFAKQKEDISKTLDHKREISSDEIAKYVNKFRGDESDACLRLAAFIIEKITDKPTDIKRLREIYSRS
jgi:F-type H+-transporting ATPase subunit b